MKPVLRGLLRLFVATVASAGMAFAITASVLAEPPPLLPDSTVAALAGEISGESAKRNLNALSLQHRMRGSEGFLSAARHIESKLQDYGFENAEILMLPTDGKLMYGTQRSRLGWDVTFAELWEVEQIAGSMETRPLRRLGNWEAMPLTLAQNSETGEVVAALIDVGAGTSAEDYAGKDVAGKLVLTSSQPGPVADLAVVEYGAAGIISYAQNQVTAWWKEDENLIRWGHLRDFAPYKTFAFMVSLKEARSLRARLAGGETILFHARVEAEQHPSAYQITTAAIIGSDPELEDQEIAFTCHLDHPHPGANDNVSGCVAILEVARSLNKLIAEGRLDRPRRTIRFFWPPEIEGSIALLNARPLIAANTKAVIHMDMVGGGPATKAVFHISRTPRSLPSFVGDVAEAFGRFVNAQTLAYASGESPDYPLTALEGGKEPLLANFQEIDLGSDHQVFGEGSFRIPYVYLHDWPDRYIHTNFDTPAVIDPTKLKRAAFIGAATAWFLANMDEESIAPLGELLKQGALTRTAAMLARRRQLAKAKAEADNLTRLHWRNERALVRSISDFSKLPARQMQSAYRFITHLEEAAGPVGGSPAYFGETATVYHRAEHPKGPMSGFGYSYLTDKLGDDEVAALRLPRYRGLWGSGGAYSFEALNFVDGNRSVGDIRDSLAAELGPVPLEIVAEYLGALETIGILLRRE